MIFGKPYWIQLRDNQQLACDVGNKPPELTFAASRHEDADSLLLNYPSLFQKASWEHCLFHFNLAVADNDSDFLKQSLELAMWERNTR